MIYLTWAIYAGGLVYFGWRGQWALAVFWLAGVPLFEWLYIHKFPSLSQSMGYGRIVDEGAEAAGNAPVAQAETALPPKKDLTASAPPAVANDDKSSVKANGRIQKL